MKNIQIITPSACGGAIKEILLLHENQAIRGQSERKQKLVDEERGEKSDEYSVLFTAEWVRF